MYVNNCGLFSNICAICHWHFTYNSCEVAPPFRKIISSLPCENANLDKDTFVPYYFNQ